jgi:anti-sigma regulatory factor (Ser/Thr protein kinase)
MAMLRSLQLPRDGQAPTLARRAVAVAAVAEALPSGVISDACLLTSELVTNSVRYGDGPVVRVRIDADERSGLRCAVLEDSAGFVPMAPALERVASGWELQLVDRVADRWGVADGSTHVWFELSLDADRDSRQSERAAQAG